MQHACTQRQDAWISVEFANCLAVLSQDVAAKLLTAAGRQLHQPEQGTACVDAAKHHYFSIGPAICGTSGD